MAKKESAATKEKDLKKLSRADLLELLVAQTKENERLTNLLMRANEELNKRQLVLNDSGSIAEAALRLSGIFDIAQAAADQYLESVRLKTQKEEEVYASQRQNCAQDCEKLIRQTEEKCLSMEEETRLRCSAVLASVKQDLQNYCEQASKKVDVFNVEGSPDQTLATDANRAKDDA